MSLIIEHNANEGMDIPQLNAGTEQAVIINIADIGTQPSQMYGPKRQVVITWALTNQHFTFDEDRGPENRVISKTYTLSTHKKAQLAAVIQGINGTSVEEDFDLMSLLGKNCILTLVVKNKEDGKSFTNVGSVGGLMAGLEPVVLPVKSFSLSSFKRSEFDEQPEWIQKKVMATPEYQRVADTPYDS